MTILVLALNPSIDAEWRVDDVLWEEKNNVSSERCWAGGKGINVARWLKQSRRETAPRLGFSAANSPSLPPCRKKMPVVAANSSRV